MLAYGINNVINLYIYLIVFRILLTWIPNVDFEKQPFMTLKDVCDPYLNIFRGLIPPIGGVLDISPVVAIILLQIMQGIIVGILYRIGL